jgi:hypothetical protein
MVARCGNCKVFIADEFSTCGECGHSPYHGEGHQGVRAPPEPRVTLVDPNVTPYNGHPTVASVHDPFPNPEGLPQRQYLPL